MDNIWWHPIIKVVPSVARLWILINFNLVSLIKTQGNKHIFSYGTLDNQQFQKRCHLIVLPLKTQIITTNYQVLLHGWSVDSSTKMEYTWNVKAFLCNILLKCVNNAHKNSRANDLDVYIPYSSLMGIRGVSKTLKFSISLS